MRRSHFLGLTLAVAVTVLASACRPDRDTTVTSRTTISGTVNGSPLAVDIVATINTGRGGTSSCRFTQLPTAFNPATLGTHL